MAPSIFSVLVGIIIHVLQCGVTYAAVQMCSGWVVVVQVHVPYIAHGVDEAVRWIHGDGHCIPIVAGKKAKGAPLGWVTPSLKGIRCHLEVNLYIGHKV